MGKKKRKPPQQPINEPSKSDFEEQLKHGREFIERYEKTFKALAKT